MDFPLALRQNIINRRSGSAYAAGYPLTHRTTAMIMRRMPTSQRSVKRPASRSTAPIPTILNSQRSVKRPASRSTAPIPTILKRLALVSILVGGMTLPRAVAAEPPIDFNREIRPILSNACFKCHGPGTQKARLRLDVRDVAVGRGVIVPGKPEQSLLLERLTATDESRMPPPKRPRH